MAWGKAGSTTLTSAGSTITVSSIPDSKFYESLIYTPNGSGTIHNITTRFNSDTGSNYAFRRSSNGGSDTTSISQTEIQVTAQQNEEFAVVYLFNISSEEKLQISHSVSLGGTGAGVAPARQEAVGKHEQTSNPIDTITVHNASAVNTYGTDSNLTVLGSDLTPADAITFPTNVQAGSRAEITDTRKMYVYIEREDSNDFSTDNMVDSDSSRIGISSGVFSANLQRDGSNDASTYTLSNTYGNEFNMKYEFQTNGLNGSPSGTFGLYSEDNTSGSTSSHDSFVALNFNDLVNVRLQAGDNTAPYGGTGTSGSWITLTANTNYFVEIVGNGDDTFTLNIRTGSHTGTLLGTQTITQTGIDNLSYWGAKNTMSSGTSGTIVTLDNLSISASSIWKEIGT